MRPYISTGELSTLSNLIGQSPQEALDLLRIYEQKYPSDVNLERNKGGFLIDIGLALENRPLIQEGIDALIKVLPTVEVESKPTFLYNLANGYSSLHNIDRLQPNFTLDPDATPLFEAKQYYRESLQGVDVLNRDLLAQLHTNYGNCLSNLGRSLEAISEYNTALKYVPGHRMALGNLGVELEHFAFIAQSLLPLRDAREALSQALSGDHLEQAGARWARPSFIRAKKRVEQLLDQFGESAGKSNSAKPNYATKYQQGYAEFCAEYQLFLNFCVGDCHQVAGDSVGFSIVTPIDDETTFPRLVRVVNGIKERYAVARLLLYETCNPPFKTQAYDGMTYYTDNLDYAVYGIRAAKLKLAFESAYNVLDKIAFFINDYLGLGLSERSISFTSIWRERQSTVLRPTIKTLDNYHLYALYNISRDLAPGGYLNHLRDIRNFLTHRYLVPHVERLHWLEAADGPEYHLGYRDLLDRTIQLMQLVRSATIYLIAFIDQEERSKHSDESQIIAPMLTYPTLHYPFGPQDTFV